MSDLGSEALGLALGGRPFRAYPALLSTGADAQAWARAGGPDGAVVVADYQASPRGRAGLPWVTIPGVTLCFAMVVHPKVSAEDEGSLYLAALLGLGDALGASHQLWWPDEVHDQSARIAAIGIDSELDSVRLTWAVINVCVEDARPDRARTLVRIAAAIEARLGEAPGPVAAQTTARCATIGRRVRARMMPLGPAGPVTEGIARTCLPDGALSITTDSGASVAVRPQHLGMLDLVADHEEPVRPGEWGPPGS